MLNTISFLRIFLTWLLGKSGVGQSLGVTDVGPEVVALVSHATQECLRGLIEKLTVMAEHRKAALKVQQSDPDPKQRQLVNCHISSQSSNL